MVLWGPRHPSGPRCERTANGNVRTVRSSEIPYKLRHDLDLSNVGISVFSQNVCPDPLVVATAIADAANRYVAGPPQASAPPLVAALPRSARSAPSHRPLRLFPTQTSVFVVLFSR